MQNKPTSYQAMHDQWSQMPPPDPITLLKLIMTPGFLTQHQMEAIKALLSNPNAAAAGGPPTAPGAAMPGPAAPAAPTAPAQPSPLGVPPK